MEGREGKTLMSDGTSLLREREILSSVKIVEKYGEWNPAAAMRNELGTITSFGRGDSSLLLLDRREIESPRRRLISPLSWTELILDSRGLTDSTFRPPRRSIG